MRDRIKELADQAGFMQTWFSESGDDCETELRKFAELIVEECTNILRKEMYRLDTKPGSEVSAQTMETAQSLIKRVMEYK